jgi:hypothetical protein
MLEIDTAAYCIHIFTTYVLRSIVGLIGQEMVSLLL